MIIASRAFDCGFAESRTRGNVKLRPDDRLDLLFAAFQIELGGSEHVAVICQGKCAHVERLGFGNQALYRCSSVEERKIGMIVKMYEI
jgi:hypothetical protein